MLKRIALISLAALVLMPAPTHASEKADLFPGIENLHRWRFIAIPITALGQIAVIQTITVQFDSPAAGVLMFLENRTDPLNVTTEAISIGSDRMATLEIGLLAGTYEIVIVGVVAPTHYHLNVTYTADELLFGGPTAPTFDPARQASDLEQEASFAPYVERLAGC
jgi:hypothetical protein